MSVPRAKLKLITMEDFERDYPEIHTPYRHLSDVRAGGTKAASKATDPDEHGDVFLLFEDLL